LLLSFKGDGELEIVDEVTRADVEDREVGKEVEELEVGVKIKGI
jgi:hypothetical protein